MNRGGQKNALGRGLGALRLVGAAPRAYDGGWPLVFQRIGNPWDHEPGAAGKQTADAAPTGGASALSNDATSLIIRDASPADAEAIARVHVDTWRSTYAGIIPDSVLVGMSASGQQAQWARQLRGRRGGEFALVAQDSEHGIIGFGSAGRVRGDAPFHGEVFTLYVLPDCQGQGIGQRLLSGLFDGLRDRGMSSAVVWVLAMNPARFFYEAMGAARAAEREERIWGEALPEFAYGWATLDITAGAARA